MSERWSWDRRRCVLRVVVLACWLTYALVVVAGLALLLPADVKQYAFAFWGVYAVFVLPPAWIHYNWVHNPGYLFGSNGIRRLRFSPQVEAQISRAANFNNAFGVPALPGNLATPRLPPSSNRQPRRGVSAKVRWDVQLYVAAREWRPGVSIPDRTMTVGIDLNPEGVTVVAGRWRPGVLFSVGYASIVGIWNGENIATIGTSDVVVLVVDSGEDQLLLPFALVRPANGVNMREAADRLAQAVDEFRSRWAAEQL